MSQSLEQAFMAFNQTADINRMHNCANQISRLLTPENMRTAANFFIRTMITGERNRVQVACCALVLFAKDLPQFTPQVLQEQALELLNPSGTEYVRLYRTIAALGICHILEVLGCPSAAFALAFAKRFRMSLACELILYQAFYQYNYEHQLAYELFYTEPMKNLGKHFAEDEYAQYSSLLIQAALVENHPFITKFKRDYHDYSIAFLQRVLAQASKDRNYTYLTVQFTELLKDQALAEKNRELLQYILPFDYLQTTVVDLLAKARREDVYYLEELIRTVQLSDCYEYKDKLIRFVITQDRILYHGIIFQFVGYVTKDNAEVVVKSVCAQTRNCTKFAQVNNLVNFMAAVARSHPKYAIILFMSAFDNLVFKLNSSQFELYPFEVAQAITDDEQRDNILKRIYQSLSAQKETVHILAECLIDNYVVGTLRNCTHNRIVANFPFLQLSYQFLQNARQAENTDYNEIMQITKLTFDYLILLSLFQESGWTTILKKFNYLVLELDSYNVDYLSNEDKDQFFEAIGASVVQFILAFVNVHSKTIQQFTIFIFKQYLPIFDAYLIDELMRFISVDYLLESMQEGENVIEEYYEQEEEDHEEALPQVDPQNDNEEDQYDRMLASIILSRKERNLQGQNIYHQVQKSLDLLKTFLEQYPDSPAVFIVLQAIFAFIQYPTGKDTVLKNYDKQYLNATIQKAQTIFESACKDKKIRELIPIYDALNGEELTLQPFIDELIKLVREKHPLYSFALLYLKLVSFSLAGILESSEYYGQARAHLVRLFSVCCEFLTQKRIVLYKDFFVDFFSVRFEGLHDVFRQKFAEQLGQLDTIKSGLLCIGVVHELFLVRSKEIPPDLKIMMARRLIEHGLKELQRQFERFNSGEEDVTFGLLERLSNDLCKFILSFAKRYPIKLSDLSVAILAAVESLKSNGVQVGQQQHIVTIWANISRLIE